MELAIKGLTTQEVTERHIKDTFKSPPSSLTKSKLQIYKDNILTLFNILNFGIALLLFSVGAYANMTFIVIIILNITIGIWQELKAKKLVDELSILNKPKAKVIRNGIELVVNMEELVKDDVMLLESGQQICSDSIILNGTVEINESLLTGESEPILKSNGNELYSGSFVVSGKCYATVAHVGKENYAIKLAEEAKKAKQISSELLNSMKKITQLTSFIIVPLGILLFMQAIFFRLSPADVATISTAAALLGMLPKGLVLLISISLASGVIRLAKMKILVQNIYSLETLAHVDVLCLDKTGTITSGKLKVKNILPLTTFKQEDIQALLASYCDASEDNNATLQALQEYFGKQAVYAPLTIIPFSSLRKWSSISFPTGTIFVGAVEKIIHPLPKTVEQEIEQGYRVIGIGFYDGSWHNREILPEKIQPLCAISMIDQLRENVASTLNYFHEEGVTVKIISGDHIKTATLVACKAGLRNWEKAIDMSLLGEDPAYDIICNEYNVFARTTPKQKQFLVKALQNHGHKVAMTGDGVNDLLALREADCSIAIAGGSDASRQISQIVLLDSDFTHLPSVVLEGRKVINNITRTAGVFFIKTIYSFLLSCACAFFNMPFPFIPLQITLVDAFIEAYPSFLTILEANTKQPRGSFLKTALSNAAPFSVAITLGILFFNYATFFTALEKHTLMYLLLIAVSVLSVIKSCLPLNKLRTFICVTMTLGIISVLLILPGIFSITAATVLMQIYFLTTLAVITICLVMFFNMKTKFTSLP